MLLNGQMADILLSDGLLQFSVEPRGNGDARAMKADASLRHPNSIEEFPPGKIKPRPYVVRPRFCATIGYQAGEKGHEVRVKRCNAIMAGLRPSENDRHVLQVDVGQLDACFTQSAPLMQCDFPRDVEPRSLRFGLLDYLFPNKLNVLVCQLGFLLWRKLGNAEIPARIGGSISAEDGLFHDQAEDFELKPRCVVSCGVEEGSVFLLFSPLHVFEAVLPLQRGGELNLLFLQKLKSVSPSIRVPAKRAFGLAVTRIEERSQPNVPTEIPR